MAYTKNSWEALPNRATPLTKAAMDRIENGIESAHTGFENAYTKAQADLLFSPKASGVVYGTGFPNGVVAAPVGTLYADEAVTNGASLWQKISGTGTTGWAVIAGDTGWRRIETIMTNLTGGEVEMRRVGDVVMITAGGVVGEPGVTSFPTMLGAGFRSRRPARQPFDSSGGVIRSSLFLSYNNGPAIEVHVPGAAGGYADYVTRDPWPTTPLPGTN